MNDIQEEGLCIHKQPTTFNGKDFDHRSSSLSYYDEPSDQMEESKEIAAHFGDR
jgi:hypothetical protein